MILKGFRINFILRTILIILSIYIFFLFIFIIKIYYIIALTGVVTFVQIVLLIHFFEKNMKFLTLFFESLKSIDFFVPGNYSAKELNTKINETMRIFRQNSNDSDIKLQYLQTILQNIGIGIVVIKENNEIVLLNRASQLFLHNKEFTKVDEFKNISKDLYNLLRNKQCKNKSLVKLTYQNETFQLLLNITDFTLLKEDYRLVTIQNIYRELDENEVDSWQKLAKALTHEIMNSIAPISSLASTSNNLLDKYIKNIKSENMASKEIISDVQNANKVIEKRSLSLISFVENYRKILRIPDPNFEVIRAKDLLDDIATLMSPELTDKGIKLKTFLYPITLELVADKDLLEQVLINLIKNSIESLENIKNPSIEISISNDMYDKPSIEITDNGKGISSENYEKIFIPFFTTKQNGSGIGLGLCRQIMRLHNGSVSFKSIPGEKTSFYLKF